MSFYECDKYFLWADFFLRSIFGVQQELYNETEHAFEKKHRREFHYNVSNEFSKIQSEVTFPPLKMHEMNETTRKHTKNQSKITFLDEINGCAQIRRVFQREMISIRLIRERGSKARVNEL